LTPVPIPSSPSSRIGRSSDYNYHRGSNNTAGTRSGSNQGSYSAPSGSSSNSGSRGSGSSSSPSSSGSSSGSSNRGSGSTRR
jgi:hypothetical protein